MTDDILAREWKTYMDHKPALLAKGFQDKYVLIKDDRVIDLFDSQERAIHEGYLRLGVVPFLAHRIAEDEEAHLLVYNIVES